MTATTSEYYVLWNKEYNSEFPIELVVPYYTDEFEDDAKTYAKYAINQLNLLPLENSLITYCKIDFYISGLSDYQCLFTWLDFKLNQDTSRTCICICNTKF